MRNIKLTVDYFGRGFKGWQRQKHGSTVQGELEKALTVICREPINVTGASRTDAGVNARGMVANFQTTSRESAARFLKSLNGLLPEGIVVTGVEDVAAGFHARKNAVWREYEYLIWNRPYRDLFRNVFTAQVSQTLDVTAMRKAAAGLTGKHDFRAFCDATSAAKGCVRTVYLVSLDEPEPGLISLTIRADGFVHKMVRSIVGTLIEVGQGKKNPGIIAELLQTGQRKMAGRTAPAAGLTLKQIEYEKKEIKGDQEWDRR